MYSDELALLGAPQPTGRAREVITAPQTSPMRQGIRRSHSVAVGPDLAPGAIGTDVIVGIWSVWVRAAMWAAILAGCGAASIMGDRLPASLAAAAAQAAAPIVRDGAVKVGLILPVSAGSDAGNAGLAMRNAAEMALAELGKPNVQLIFKDDGGSGPGAQLAARQAISEGAEVILGPLFAASVTAVRQIARVQEVPIIAFSTDIKAAAPGTYLLSFLPESEVDRVVAYAISRGRRSFIGLLPSSAYGSVVESDFKKAVSRGGGRVMALEHYKDTAKIADAARIVTAAASRADAIFIADRGPVVSDVVDALAAAGANLHQFALLGTQLWDDPKVFSNPLLEGGWYPGPDPAGFRAFAQRYNTRYHDDPPRFATHAYDAITLVAALARTQGSPRITDEVLTNPNGFSGIDGNFRFRTDGSNQREFAILRVTPSGGRVLVPASASFSGAAR